MEDLRLVHSEMGVKTLISLEEDEIIYHRQLFNRRPHVKNIHQTSEDFIEDLDVEPHFAHKHLIVWLDYAAPGKRGEQLIKYRNLIGKLRAGDIVKITMNANPETLGAQCGERPEQTQDKRLQKLRNQLGAFLQAPVEPSQMTAKGLLPILCQSIKNAALGATQNRSDIQPVPVAISAYQDSEHQMLTLTVYLCESNQVERLSRKLTQAGWEYMPSGWEDISRINLPNLSPKERLHIEGLLSRRSPAAIHIRLPFRFDESDEVSLRILQQYVEHYRRYPNYFQVVL